MEYETELEHMRRDWNENIDSIFGLMDKLEAAEKLNELKAADLFIEKIGKRRERLKELDYLIHAKRGMGKFLLEKKDTFETGE